MNSISTIGNAREVFDTRIGAIRPKLHRYCARLVGSAMDGEDVVQEALASAFYNWPDKGVQNLEAWLFRIAHNKAIDHLRRSGRYQAEPLEEHALGNEADSPLEAKEKADYALTLFLQLTPLQRSSVILKDFLGFTLAEISNLLDSSIGAIKAALYRARANLRQLVNQAEHRAPTPPASDLALLQKYAKLFSERDFDGLRDMLAEEVRLELVTKLRTSGAKEVGNYYGNYGKVAEVSVIAVWVDGLPALSISDDGGAYYIMLVFAHGRVAAIRDFRYARYHTGSVFAHPIDQCPNR